MKGDFTYFFRSRKRHAATHTLYLQEIKPFPLLKLLEKLSEYVDEEFIFNAQ